MNYLAIYNKELKKTRGKICDKLNRNYNAVEIGYSRYPEIVDRFPIVMPFNSIKIKEAEKGTISFTFNIEDVQFQKGSDFFKEWEHTFDGLRSGFAKNRYLDIKEKLLEVTDEKNLNDFLANTYLASTLDSTLGGKIIETFKETTMYKNICDDYKNFNRNYKKFAKSNSHEVEIFTLEFLNNGRIRMIYKVGEKEKKKSYDDFENIITFIVDKVDWVCEVMRHIKKECELFEKRSR